jgi:hypothetical protein
MRLAARAARCRRPVNSTLGITYPSIAMLRKKLISALLLLVASAQGAQTAAQQRCITRLQAEQARI